MSKIGFSVKREVPRIDAELMKEYQNFSTPTLCDVMGLVRAMDWRIKPVVPGMRICGQAVTVRLHPGDNLMLHAAVEVAEPGQILVVDNHGEERVAPWGELLTLAAKAKGIGGLVIDGMVRDIAQLREIGFPIFAKGVVPNGTNKEGPGEVNVPISCGGIPICPGDLVVGDDDGVVVVPRDIIADVLKLAAKKVASEKDRRAEIANNVFVRPNLLKKLSDLGVM